jgi:hypothetical protein
MVKAAAVAVRESDPQAVIVLGGISRAHDPFLRELITQHHVDRYVDVVAMHGYPESWLPERIETVFGDWVKEVSEMLRASGSGVDLWVNEMGYADWRYSQAKASIYGSPVYYDYEHTTKYAADALFKAEMLALASGTVSMAGWYRIDDFCNADFSGDAVNYHLGVVDCAGHEKPASRALAYFNRLFGQPVRQTELQMSASPHSGVVVKAFERADGHVIIAMWLRSPETAEAKGLDGAATDKRSETLSVELPCKPARTQLSGATGAPVSSMGKMDAKHWTGLEIRGGPVLVADVTCVTPERDRIPLTATGSSANLSSR